MRALFRSASLGLAATLASFVLTNNRAEAEPSVKLC